MRVFRIESRIIILEGQYLVREKVLHQRPLFGGANLKAPRLSGVFCRYTTHTIPYYGSFKPTQDCFLATTYLFCYRVTPTICSHGCKNIPVRDNTECWLEAELWTFMPDYGVPCQSKGATFARLTCSQAEASARHHRHSSQAPSLIVCL